MSQAVGPADVGRLAGTILDEVERAVVGKRLALQQVLVGMLAKGHVLMEDFPGLAKTLVARSFGQAIGLGYSRIQFTPDLLPTDVTGSSVYNPRDGELTFQPGPIFASLVLGDEINRATPKTQSALLEAMGEQQVTVDGSTRPLPSPFVVLATQNPIEFEGTYPLPEAQLDRFVMRVRIGYPEPADEAEMLQRRMDRGSPVVELDGVTDRATFLAMQEAVESVHVATDLVDYVVSLVRATRSHAGVRVGASPRGSLALLTTSRALAAVCGRDFVTPEDLKALAVPCLAHRLDLRAELWVRGTTGADIVTECLATVPLPPTQATEPATVARGSAP
ncbi:MAG: AAA family ATPase [Acidimicrobiales bacterium]